ncbi:MAG: TolC family protein, partial [Bacteroidales bacterium]|nr:TolC family protein [Bacteroidales bacterium]
LSEFMSYENNKSLLALALQNLETSHENYDTAMERYRLGELSGIELREVQENLHDAEESVIDAKYQVKLAEISLQQLSASITDYMQ